ncbi:DUF6933 domain-containing protein [Aurantivibrio plasticivorans]
MLLIEVSKELAKPLSRHVYSKCRPNINLQPDLLWNAEIAQIGSNACVVAQEQYTHYILVFCGLNKDDFAQFPLLFTDRLWREAVAICQQANLYDRSILSTHLKQIFDSQSYRLNPEPLEEGKLLKVIEKLERRFLYDKEPLPMDGKSAFEYTFPINTRKPKSQQQDDRPSAAEALGNYCLNLVGDSIENQPTKPDPVIATTDNIVKVNFSQHR